MYTIAWFLFADCPVFVGAEERDAAGNINAIITNHSQTMVFTNIITRLPVRNIVLHRDEILLYMKFAIR